MRAASLSGDKSRPLVIAFHGFTQRVVGMSARRQFRRNFLELSGLWDACESRNWSLWAPQAPYTNWTREFVRDLSETAAAQSLVEEARRDTLSDGRVIAAGFSDGVMPAHTLAAAVPTSSLWAYSGFMPPWVQPDRGCLVAVTWDENDIKKIARVSAEVADIYTRNGNTVLTRNGHMGGHHWDVRLNNEVMDYLTSWE